MTRARLPLLAALLVVAAGAISILLAQRPPAPTGPPAVLVIVIGSVELTRSGSTAAAARSGAMLTAGDRVATGPGTKAAVVFAGGDFTRLNSGAIADLGSTGPTAAEVRLVTGRTWNVTLGAGALALTVPGGAARSRGASEFEVGSGVGGSVLHVVSGEVAGTGVLATNAGAPPAADGWTVFNLAADQSALAGGDLLSLRRGAGLAIGSGAVAAGEESSLQQGVELAARAPDLAFTLGWPAGEMALDVVGPDGRVAESLSSSRPPITIVVRGPGAGSWRYRVRAAAIGAAPAGWYAIVAPVAPTGQGGPSQVL